MRGQNVPLKYRTMVVSYLVIEANEVTICCWYFVFDVYVDDVIVSILRFVY